MSEIGKNKDSSFMSLSVLLIVIMTITALWFFNYEFPNGEEATLLSFIGIFFRELVILLIIVVVLAILITERIRAFLKLRKNKNA